MGCVVSTPSGRKRTTSADNSNTADKLSRKHDGRQEGQVAQVHATTLLQDEDQPPPAVGLRKTYGPDGYELVGQLGAGKTGTMKLMRNRRTKELVVARCIPHSATGLSPPNPECVHRISREVLNHRRLLHPNIITFHEIFNSPKSLVTIMEYAQGGHLSERVATTGRLNEAQAQHLFRQLVEGMSFCHDNFGMCHRDLRMDNLLLSGSFFQPVLKITGFVYSKPVQHESVTEAFYDRLSAAYMAPELLLGQSCSRETIDGAALDVWSCGVILYNMVIGQLPFDSSDPSNSTAKKMAQRIVRCEYGFPDDVPLSGNLKNLISRILVKTPEERITLAEIAAHPWLKGVKPIAAPSVKMTSQTEESVTHVLSSGPDPDASEKSHSLPSSRSASMSSRGRSGSGSGTPRTLRSHALDAAQLEEDDAEDAQVPLASPVAPPAKGALDAAQLEVDAKAALANPATSPTKKTPGPARVEVRVALAALAAGPAKWAGTKGAKGSQPQGYLAPAQEALPPAGPGAKVPRPRPLRSPRAESIDLPVPPQALGDRAAAAGGKSDAGVTLQTPVASPTKAAAPLPYIVRTPTRSGVKYSEMFGVNRQLIMSSCPDVFDLLKSETTPCTDARRKSHDQQNKAPLARWSKDPGVCEEEQTPPRAKQDPLARHGKGPALRDTDASPPTPEMRPVSSGGSVSQPGTPPLTSGHRAVVTPPDGARREFDAMPASPFEAGALQLDDSWRTPVKHSRTVSVSIPFVTDPGKREIRTSGSGSGSFGSLRWSRSRSVGRTRAERLASADASADVPASGGTPEEEILGLGGSSSPRELSEAIQARLKTLLSSPASSTGRHGSETSETPCSSRPDSPATPDKKIIEMRIDALTSSRDSAQGSAVSPTPPAATEADRNAKGDRPRIGGSVRAITEALQQQARSKPWQKFLPARQKLDTSARQNLTILHQEPAKERGTQEGTVSPRQNQEGTTLRQNVTVKTVLPSVRPDQEKDGMPQNVTMIRQTSLQSDDGVSARQGRPAARAAARRAMSASGNGSADGRLGGRLSDPNLSLKAGKRPAWAQPLGALKLPETPATPVPPPADQPSGVSPPGFPARKGPAAPPRPGRPPSRPPSRGGAGPRPGSAGGTLRRATPPALPGSPAPVWTQDAFWEADPDAVQNLVLQYWDVWGALDAHNDAWATESPCDALIAEAMRLSDDEDDIPGWVPKPMPPPPPAWPGAGKGGNALMRTM